MLPMGQRVPKERTELAAQTLARGFDDDAQLLPTGAQDSLQGHCAAPVDAGPRPGEVVGGQRVASESESSDVGRAATRFESVHGMRKKLL